MAFDWRMSLWMNGAYSWACPWGGYGVGLSGLGGGWLVGQSRQRFAGEELSRRGMWREMGLAAWRVKKWWIAR